MAKITALTVILAVGLAAAEVPSYITICGRKNPHLNECVKNSAESLRDRIAVGLPELDVPKSEPFFLPEGLPLADTTDLKAYARNIELYGVSKFEVKNINVDLEHKKFDIDVYFKTLKLKGDYDVSAKIVVPVNAKGPVEIDAEDVLGKAVMKYQLVNTKKGLRVFFSEMSLKLNIKDYHSKFVPRTGPDAKFGEAINAVLNTNRQEVIAGILPSMEKSVSAKLLELANRICKNFTYDELFPDRE